MVKIRKGKEPVKVGIGYKLFFLKNGQLFPPMVANPGGSPTPLGLWLDASDGVSAGISKTGRPQVVCGGKGTHKSGRSKLAYRPGWHIGKLPIAIQFESRNGILPVEFVWAEVAYSAEIDYQKEATQAGISENGKFRHAYAGLKHIPTDGFYRYRTNPNPKTEEWVIAGSMRVNRILPENEVSEILLRNGRIPQKRA